MRKVLNWPACCLPSEGANPFMPTRLLANAVISSPLATCFLLDVSSVPGQTRSRASRPSSARISNQQIAQIVRQIDARNIERTIHKLVSFGTRNTLSEQSNPNRLPATKSFGGKPRHLCGPTRANVGKVTSYTMKGMSKDKFFFAVRAVDSAGNQTPVSFPKPVR